MTTGQPVEMWRHFRRLLKVSWIQRKTDEWILKTESEKKNNTAQYKEMQNQLLWTYHERDLLFRTRSSADADNRLDARRV